MTFSITTVSAAAIRPFEFAMLGQSVSYRCTNYRRFLDLYYLILHLPICMPNVNTHEIQLNNFWRNFEERHLGVT